MKLNTEQQQARDHGDGACVIEAGPGSGKTETVSQLYVRRIEDGVRPDRLLFVTFTNRAAQEMRSRVLGKVGGISPRSLWIGTFHGMCVRLLKRIDADYLDGRRRDFCIYDQKNSLSVVRAALNSIEGDEIKKRRDRSGGPDGVLEWIEDKKRALLEPEDVHVSKPEDDIARRVWIVYEKKLRQANAFDFTDLLRVTTRIAESDTSPGRRLRSMFDYVMVDEYQDTNELQFRLVQALGHAGNITVVGDVDQSIYAFRGAQPTNMRDFRKAHGGCKVVRLQTNYRSTGAIVDFCNDVIAANTLRDEKVMSSNQEQGELPHVIRYDSGESEARDIARQVRQLLVNGVSAGDIGIMYRQHSLSRAIEGALRDLDVDYMMVAGVSFYQREEVMDLLAYLSLLVHPESTEHYKRVIRSVPNVGDKTVDQLFAYARQQRLTPVAATILYATKMERARRRTAALVELGQFLEQATERARTMKDLAALGNWVLVESGVLARYQRRLDAVRGTGREEDKARSKVDTLKEVISAMHAYAERTVRHDEQPSLSGYLESAALMREGDDVEGDRVKLLTIHAAKGLEFHAGFVLGVDQGICPPDKPMDLTEREEERRCLYVAASRAKRVLVLSSAAWRYIWGKDVPFEPSDFLAGIDPARYRFRSERRPSFAASS